MTQRQMLWHMMMAYRCAFNFWALTTAKIWNGILTPPTASKKPNKHCISSDNWKSFMWTNTFWCSSIKPSYKVSSLHQSLSGMKVLTVAQRRNKREWSPKPPTLSVLSLYADHILNRAKKIIRDSSHPSHDFFWTSAFWKTLQIYASWNDAPQ